MNYTNWERELLSRVHLESQMPRLGDDDMLKLLRNSSHMSSGRPTQLEPLTREMPPFSNECHLPSVPLHVFSPPKTAQTTEEKLLGILLLAKVRRGARELVEPHLDQIMVPIRQAVSQKKPLVMTVLTLAAKAPNPLATGQDVDMVDYGEELFFYHMRDLLESLNRVYEYGVKLVIVMDARGYVGYRTHPDDEPKTERYMEHARDLRDHIGLRDRVAMLDLMTLANQDSNFMLLREQLKLKLRDLYTRNSEVRCRIDNLAAAMLTYLPVPNFDLETTQRLLSLAFCQLPDWLREASYLSAFNRSAMGSALSLLQIVKKSLPEALRLTVHVKSAAQIPIWMLPQSAPVLPHNGVPLVNLAKLERTGDPMHATRIVHRRHILTRPDVFGAQVSDRKSTPNLDESQVRPYYYCHSGVE